MQLISIGLIMLSAAVWELNIIVVLKSYVCYSLYLILCGETACFLSCIMAYIWPILVIATLHLAQCNQEENKLEDIQPYIYQPSWMYTCVPDEGCERSDQPEPTGNTTNPRRSQTYESLDLCRTVCGRFGGFWPKPITAVLSTQTVKIHPNFLRFDLVDVPAEARQLMIQMTQLVGPNLMAECNGNVTDLVETPVMVYISVKNAATTLTWDTDEQYMLDLKVKDGEISTHIVAETVFGARHALETFTQLVASTRPEYSNSNACSLRIVSGAKIRDRPVYKHRGFLLDSSRHFIPLVDIKRTLDGMASTKLNVFHWHVTDSHSFPLESSRVPQFTRYGAYSAEEIYTTEEVRGLVQYAKVRGIRMVIEIDSPAHAANGWQWGKDYGFGDLAVCVNAKPWRQLCIQPPCGQLNPANSNMYRYLKELYQDIADFLGETPLLHVGGDEVFINCWNSSQEIVTYMKNQGYDRNVEGFMQLWSEFHYKALEAWDDVTKSSLPVMIWSSELTQAHRIQNYLDKNRYIIEVWEPLSSPLETMLLRMGYRIVSVPKDIWYLDHGFWGMTKYSNWRRMYSHVLPNHDGVLGGEVAMWSEYVDENALDTRVWPRLAAVAERLWANPSGGVYGAETRLNRHRARLIARGLRPDAIAPQWCDQHDNRCL
ncbi:hypothetical protein K1T71_005997 [Dendrolimus kikuchii]|uniref:Uncharacterized protein n=1 Tax=Dendrolimus kikuchii TaxID=765133 RepID=A0ACC1D2J1_9NEOP|nr:hypothetical protein K1T71_005997 [Dendrolimus kikuchii]